MSWTGFGRTLSDPRNHWSMDAFGAGTGARRSVRPAVRNGLGRWARGVLASRGRMASRSSASARIASATLLAQRRRRRTDQQVIKGAQGGPSTSSQFELARPASTVVKTIKDAGNPQYYITNGASQIVCTQGFQEQGIFRWQSSGDLTFILGKVPGGGSAGVTNSRYVLESTQGELLITNSSLATAFVEIYDIARKRDANVTTYAWTADPGYAWNQGIINEEPYGSGHTLNDINSSPYDSQPFKDFFKVLKKTRVEMPQGALHRHHVSLKLNMLVSGSVLDYVDGDPADYTFYSMIVFKGQPASVKDEGGAVEVTTAKIALDVVASNRYKYTYSEVAPSLHFTTDNLVTLANEQVVSAGAGTIVPNEIA